MQSSGIARGVTIGGIDVGGLSSGAALEKVNTAWLAFQSESLVFRADEKDITIPVIGTKADEDVVVPEIVSLDAVGSVNAAARFGRRGSIWQQLRERLSAFVGRPHEFAKITVASDELIELVASAIDTSAAAPVDAAIEFVEDQPRVTDSATGTSYAIESAIRAMTREVGRLGHGPIIVTPRATQPTFITSNELRTVASQGVAAVVARAPITLSLDEQKWTIDDVAIKTLLGFRQTTADKVAVGFDETKTAAFLNTIRKEVDREPREARFEIVAGKVKAFSTSAVGRTLENSKTIAALNALLDTSDNNVGLVVSEQKPVSESIGTNGLGIAELVAEGVTDFKGSPTNRRYNLSYGAQILNGLLIKPGETFSLVTALGKIDGKNGWKPELVIKGAKITPEYGGGLCQVATTLFRAALNAGLPIVERRNHSLRISYYEPPIGLDATIYEPKPDLRFTNDYGSHLLIQTEVVGTLLKFRFYGTKDGRTVDLPEPKVYDRVGIPATKYVEVDDLKPGEKECQVGHPGAKATATYTVTYADGKQNKQVFESTYRVMAPICRIGRAAPKTTKPKPTNTNTSTNTNTTTNTNTSSNVNASE